MSLKLNHVVLTLPGFVALTVVVNGQRHSTNPNAQLLNANIVATHILLSLPANRKRGSALTSAGMRGVAKIKQVKTASTGKVVKKRFSVSIVAMNMMSVLPALMTRVFVRGIVRAAGCLKIRLAKITRCTVVAKHRTATTGAASGRLRLNGTAGVASGVASPAKRLTKNWMSIISDRDTSLIIQRGRISSPI